MRGDATHLAALAKAAKRKREHQIEETLWLLEGGTSAFEIPRRVNLSAGRLTQILTEEGHTKAAAALEYVRLEERKDREGWGR